ncbi:GatB/YqeY domain-containing protein [bacterium]|jgi:hypothetical protein|nr:GatB/YqeY domain-containing protein [bacterium]
MTLREQIIKDKMEAMKSGNTIQKNVLSTLQGEFERNNKTPDDSIVISQIKKMIDSNIECKTESENVYLEIYLPKKLSDNEVIKIIENVIKENDYKTMKDMGKIMTYLSTNYSGKYDSKFASENIKSRL